MTDIHLWDEQISTSHRFPASTRFMQGKRVIENQQPSLPPISVRFVSRDICSKLHSNHRLLRHADLKNFSIDNSTTIFVNENLTCFRKNLLWKTKQKAKENSFKYTRTTYGNVFARRSEIHNSIMIKNEQDLNLIKSHRLFFEVATNEITRPIYLCSIFSSLNVFPFYDISIDEFFELFGSTEIFELSSKRLNSFFKNVNTIIHIWLIRITV